MKIELDLNQFKMKHLKILFVDHTASLGGAELSLLDLATAYRQTSKVLLFEDGLFRERLASREIEVEVMPIPKKVLNLRASASLEAFKTIPQLWAIAGLVAANADEFDLIHANSQKAFIVSALATLRGSPPVVWHLRDILTAKQFSSVNRRVAVTLANRFAAKVLVNSQATGEAFVTAGGRKELVEVVYNGFDSEPFDRIAPEKVRAIREHLGVQDVPVVGLFSRLSYWKGQHILLSALKELPQVHALLVGEALFGEAEYVSQIKAIAAEPQLKDRIHWLGFRDDIALLMKACDIVVHTSTEPEPFGRVIVEGQLAQRPVIASAAGGALELIEDGVSGCHFPPGDVDALHKAIALVIENSSMASNLAQQGYIHAKQNFSLVNVLHSFERAISLSILK